MQPQTVIRQQLQTRRAALSHKQQENDSKKICEQLVNSQLLDTATHIALYLPIKGEADPTYLCHLSQFSDKQFYLPVLSTTQDGYLNFAKYDTDTVMTLNRFKIPEPTVRPSERLEDGTTLDCVIMPLVGVDTAGNRIGMGGGFYDRTFAFKKKDCNAMPILVGFCYDFQLIASQTPQDWDVPVDAIATQSACKRI